MTALVLFCSTYLLVVAVREWADAQEGAAL